MFPNLEVEISRKRISKQDLAKTIHKSYKTLLRKLSGKCPLTLDEAEAIAKEYFPEMRLEYLFSNVAEERPLINKSTETGKPA